MSDTITSRYDDDCQTDDTCVIWLKSQKKTLRTPS